MTIQKYTTGSYVNAKGGAFPSHWLQNFNQMPDNSNVKGVVLLIGINGISRESDVYKRQLHQLAMRVEF